MISREPGSLTARTQQLTVAETTHRLLDFCPSSATGVMGLTVHPARASMSAYRLATISAWVSGIGVGRRQLVHGDPGGTQLALLTRLRDGVLPDGVGGVHLQPPVAECLGRLPECAPLQLVGRIAGQGVGGDVAAGEDKCLPDFPRR